MAEENLDRDDLEKEDLEYEEQNQEESVNPEDYKKMQEELEKVRKVLHERNEEAKKHRLEAKKYKEIGLSPDEIAEIRKEKEESERRKAEEKGQWDKLRAQLEKQKQEELSAKDNEVQQMRSTLEKYLIDGAAASAISKFDGTSELLMPHIRQQTKVVQDENGQYKALVVDENGDPQLNINGDYKSIEDLVKEMRESDIYGVAFRARHQSGTGSRPGASNGQEGGKARPTKTRSEMSSKEQQEWIKKLGGYQAFKEQVPWK